jgi:predicted  nucleic acid-binding Zn-ribbon protein
LNSKLTLYDALVSINVPGDHARAVVEALEHEMYTALATKADLAHQAQLFSERLERLRLEIRADRLEDMATLRAEIRASRDELRVEMQAGDAALRAEMHAGFRKLETADASILADMHAGFGKLEAADAAIRVEIAQLATTLTLRMGVGLAAVAGLVISAQQFL